MCGLYIDIKYIKFSIGHRWALDMKVSVWIGIQFETVSMNITTEQQTRLYKPRLSRVSKHFPYNNKILGAIFQKR